jgi:hypothetical protein
MVYPYKLRMFPYSSTLQAFLVWDGHGLPLPPPAEPAPSIGQGLDVALGTFADHLDRNKFNPITALEEHQEHLRFRLEMVCVNGQLVPGL